VKVARGLLVPPPKVIDPAEMEMAEIVARQTLLKPEYFLQQAKQAELDPGMSGNRLPFLANLEVAIVYGRSVTWHIEEEFKGHIGFDDWFRNLQDATEKDTWEFSVSGVTLLFTTALSKLSLRSALRSQITLLSQTGQRRQSFGAAVVPLSSRPRLRVRLPASPLGQSAALPAEPSQRFYFAETEWTEVSAIQLVGQYLAAMREIILKVEGYCAASST
jgi:hypothetical protein